MKQYTRQSFRKEIQANLSYEPMDIEEWRWTATLADGALVISHRNELCPECAENFGEVAERMYMDMESEWPDNIVFGSRNVYVLLDDENSLLNDTTVLNDLLEDNEENISKAFGEVEKR